jgi:energy-coupling factor transport system permease protein
VTRSARGLAAAAHPFTPFALSGAIVVLAFLLPGPWGPPLLYGAVLLLVVVAGTPGAVVPAAIVCLPLWGFLLLLHGVLGEAPHVEVGGLRLSGRGLELAVAQAGRLGAIATASFALLQSFRPSRFVDAVAQRGWSFHAAYLLVATMQAVPRLRSRARGILDAQRARGLRWGGSPVRRARALVPLVLPLVLGAIAEVDDRAVALETRAVEVRGARTPLAPPPDRIADRLVRVGALAAVAAAAAWRLFR